MNAHIVFGLFALYVAVTSLYMVLSGRHDSVLETLRRFWGRTIGHLLYFVARVAVPILICVFCLGWGVRNYDAELAANSFKPSLQLNVESYRDMLRAWQNERKIDHFEIIYGA